MATFKTGLGDRFIQAIAISILVLAWFVVTEAGIVSPVILPRPALVWNAVIDLVQSQALYRHVAVTTFELFCAFAIAAVLGLTAGFWIGSSRYNTQVFEPLIAGIYAVPLIIFVPLFILMFGLGVQSKIAFGATYAFFPIALNTIGGIRQIDSRHLLLARSMKATPQQTFFRVILPGSLPVIVTGLRVGCVTGFLSIIAVEMLASLEGLGSEISRLSEAMRTSQMYAYIIIVIFLAALLNLLLSRVEARFAAKDKQA